ncbi:hypothetical protein [Nocardia salmonicida]
MKRDNHIRLEDRLAVPAPRKRPSARAPAAVAEVCNALIDLLESTGLTNKQFLEAAPGLGLAEEKKLSRHLLGQVSSGPSAHFAQAIIAFAAHHHRISASTLVGEYPPLSRFVEQVPADRHEDDGILLESAAMFHGTDEQKQQAGWLVEMVMAGNESMAAVALMAFDAHAPDAALEMLRVIARCDPGVMVALMDETTHLFSQARSEEFIRRLSDRDRPAAHAVEHWPRPTPDHGRWLRKPWRPSHLAAIDRMSPHWSRLRRLAAYVEDEKSSWRADQARVELVDLVDKGHLQVALTLLLGIADSSRSKATKADRSRSKVTKAFQDFTASLAVGEPQVMHTLLSELATTQSSRFRDFLAVLPPLTVGGFLRIHCTDRTRLNTDGGRTILRQVLMSYRELPHALVRYLELTRAAPREYASDILLEQLPNRASTLDNMVDHNADAAAALVVDALGVAARERPADQVHWLARQLGKDNLWTSDNEPSKLLTALITNWPVEASALLAVDLRAHFRTQKVMRLLELNNLLVIRWASTLPPQEAVQLLTVLARAASGNSVMAGASIWGPMVENAPDVARSLLLHAANNLSDDGLLLIEVAAKYHRGSDWEVIARVANSSDTETLNTLLAQVPLTPPTKWQRLRNPGDG